MSETFHVGDEVQHILEDGRIMETRFVITSLSHDGSLNGIGKDGIAFCDKNPARWHKTGRHFAEAEKLMKALEADHDTEYPKKGKWIMDENLMCTCSECGYETFLRSRYCSECGARMDEE